MVQTSLRLRPTTQGLTPSELRLKIITSPNYLRQVVQMVGGMPFLFMIFFSTTMSPGAGVGGFKEMRYLFPRFYFWCHSRTPPPPSTTRHTHDHPTLPSMPPSAQVRLAWCQDGNGGLPRPKRSDRTHGTIRIRGRTPPLKHSTCIAHVSDITPSLPHFTGYPTNISPRSSLASLS